MREGRVRVGLVALTLIAPLGTAAPPASALTVKSGVFIAQARTTGGSFGYPCIDDEAATTIIGVGVSLEKCPVSPTRGDAQVTLKSDPKGLPNVNMSCGWTCNHAGFTFASTFPSCIDAGASIKKSNTAGGCTIGAAGSQSGWCGLSTGAGNLAYTSSNGTTYVTSFKVTDIGSVWYITGGNAATNIYAIAYAFGPVPLGVGGWCLTKTLTTMTLVGSFVMKVNVP